MADEVRLAKADLKLSASQAPVTMRGLWRLVSWGTTAAAALLIAVLSSRGVVGSQRAAVAVSTLDGNAAAAQTAKAARELDSQTETKRLSDAVRELAAENDELKARIATVEHSVDDVTGSIAEEAKTRTAAAAAAPAPPWPDADAPVAATPAAIAAVVAPALPLPMEYGADIGGAASIQALRARWAGMHSAHPQVFAGLTPTVSLSQASLANRAELRLVVGPLSSADAATKLCASLERFHLFCQPTIFAGQHVALQ
jgi:hypothetical protein